MCSQQKKHQEGELRHFRFSILEKRVSMRPIEMLLESLLKHLHMAHLKSRHMFVEFKANSFLKDLTNIFGKYVCEYSANGRDENAGASAGGIVCLGNACASGTGRIRGVACGTADGDVLYGGFAAD